jgi:Alr-MurF fusion protein
MSYNISNIKNILGGTWALPPQSDTLIEHLLIDSRKISFPASSLFFAIVGERNDGHDFVKDVYARGVRNFIVSDSQKIDFQYISDASIIMVPDVLRGLQQLAAYHRAQFPDLKVIGITGSNGKTIVKEWLYQLLKEDFNIVRSPKSYNSQVGVPLSVWQIKAEHNLAIFEAGVSKKGEMAHLEKIIKPSLGILTNIGEAHTEGFTSDEKKLREKLLLFKNAETLILQKELVEKFPSIEFTKPYLTWSKHNRATALSGSTDLSISTDLSSNTDLQIIDIQLFKNSTRLSLLFKNEKIDIEIPFTDTASIDNVATCLLAVLNLNSHSNYKEKLKNLEPVAMRLELKAGINDCLVVNDAYNSDLNSLQIALDFIAQQSRQLKRTVILSDILQSGQNSTVLYQKIGELLLEKGISKLISIGENVAQIKQFFNGKKQNMLELHFFKTTSDFLKHVKNTDFQDEIILLKGARPFEFELIAERLAQKSHKTVLEINLNALSHNLAYFKSLLAPTTQLMAMVKASAYGNGSDEVARLLEFHKVNYLAVAYSDEGIELRNAGVNLPIMVMNPEEESFDALRRYNLEPEIYSLRILKNYIDFVKNQTEKQSNDVYKIHLKLDTGMHRLGFESIDIQELIHILKTCKNINIASIFTHLAGTESADLDTFTEYQVSQYLAMYAQITEGVGYRPIRHVLNSSGITRHKGFHFDMVRLGIGLYGVDGNGAFQSHLEVVQTLKASISQIKNVALTDTIGYSRRGILHKNSRIATISIGYADGLLRGLGNGKFSVLVKGKRAPIVGSVCMDMTMIDITDIPEAEEGDEVEIFGKNILVQELASLVNTIPYEIFTGISERVKRVYFQE